MFVGDDLSDVVRHIFLVSSIVYFVQLAPGTRHHLAEG